MEHLAAFLKRFGRRPTSRTWLGARPAGRDGAVAQIVASMLGLPSSGEFRFEKHEFLRIDRARAAYLLAYIATTSLAYGSNGPSRVSYRKLAAEALADLAPDAIFLTNTADWGLGRSISFRQPSLSSARFEAGLIGFDSENAFMFWVEEED
jgi:hypothetical protein